MIIRELLTKLGFTVDEGAWSRFGAMIVVANQGLELMGELAEGVEHIIESVTGQLAKEGIEILRLSHITGLSVEKLQEMKFAGDELGVSIESQSRALFMFTRNMGLVAQGAKGPAMALMRLGISPSEAGGDPGKLFDKVMTRLSEVGNTQQRVAIASQLMGRSVFELLPMLAEGPEKIAELKKAFEEYAYVLSDADVHALRNYEERVNEVRLIHQSIERQARLGLLPIMTALTVKWRDLLQAHRETIRLALDKLFKLIALAADLLLQVVDKLIAAVESLTKVFEEMADFIRPALISLGILLGTVILANIESIALGILRLIALGPLLVASYAPLVIPLALVSLAIAMLGLFIDDIYEYGKGDKETVIGHLIEQTKEWFKLLDDKWRELPPELRLLLGFVGHGGPLGAFAGFDKGIFSDYLAERFGKSGAGAGGAPVSVGDVYVTVPPGTPESLAERTGGAVHDAISDIVRQAIGEAIGGPVEAAYPSLDNAN